MKRAALAACLVACGGAPSRDGAVSVTIPPAAAATQPAPSPPRVLPPVDAPRFLARAQGYCFLDRGHVYCSSLDARDRPLVRDENAVADLDDAASFAIGDRHGCAVTTRGTVKCWGDNTFGQLGAKLRDERHAGAVEVVGVKGARRVFVGPWHACATLGDGALECWGRNDSGQAGSDTRYLPEARELVHAEPVPGVRTEHVACGFGATCATATPRREAWCWGASPIQQPTGLQNQRPMPFAGLDDVEEIAAGDSAFCAVRRGKVVCWGDGARLIPGGNASTGATTEVPGIDRAKHVAVANEHACALDAAGRVSCFGYPYSGALGVPVEGASNAYEPAGPAVVPGLPPAQTITVASTMSCALTRGGDVHCWGTSYSDKATHHEMKPVPITLR